MEELAINEQQIIVQQGSVIFNDFERIKQQAIRLAALIKTVEVDEENLKQSKKLLASVNNRVKLLEEKRIEIKKTMLQPYQEFEAQVKEIVGIVKEADDVVRQQVRQLEEEERAIKAEILEDRFKKRIVHYSFRDLFNFKDFLQPKHLNKTTQIDAVEAEMIQFLERITKDLKVIEAMPSAEALLSAYIESKDLAAAIAQVQREEAKRKQIEASAALKKQPTEDKIAYLVSAKCYSQKEMKLCEMILQQNGFEFTTDKVEV
jgi:hypothetical protein